MRSPLAVFFFALASAASAQDAVPPDGGAYPYRAIIERPLFDPDRRPVEPLPEVEAPPPPMADSGPAPQEPLTATLLGVFTGEGRALAVVQRGSDGRMVRLSKGESVDGWKLIAIDVRSVDFERGGERQKLELTGPNQAVPPPVP
jgi:hypothetical protein